MNVGEMKHRITIESKTRTPDDIGGATVAWGTFKTVWARIESVLGNEKKYAGRLDAEITHVITCRSKSVTGTTPAMRIVHESRVFQVRSVVRKNEVDLWTTILAIEGAGS